MKRIYFLDLIRVFLAIVVFCHHSAISFGALGDWYYLSRDSVSGITQVLLSVNMGVDQAYFMSLFFFISAYFLPGTIDRKGVKSFMMDRINRLGIPLLLFYFVLSPFLVYWIYGFWGKPDLGPMWFVFSLLFFEFAYVVYRSFGVKRFKMRCERPKILFIIMSFVILTGLLAFVVRLWFPMGKEVFGLQIGFFPSYVVMYFLGIVAYRNQWLERLNIKIGYMCGIVGLLMALSLLYVGATQPNCIDYFSGGFNGYALYYAVWESIMCACVCYFLLALGKFYFNTPSSVICKLSMHSYSFYIIHPFFIVGCVFVMESLPLSPLMRLILVCIIGIPLCLAVAIGVRKLLRIAGVRI